MFLHESARRNLSLSPTELAYLAGFFDGEGCVGIKKPSKKRGQHAPYVTVSQLRPEVLQRFKAAFGGNIRFAHRCGKNGIWAWQTTGMKGVIPFLDQIEPYLLVKRAEAQVVIDAFKPKVRGRKAGIPAEIIDIREAARVRVMGMRK